MSNPYISGIADWWYSGPITDLWVEFKYLKIPRTRGLVCPDLSELQKRWTTDRYNEGRNVRVIIGCPQGAVVYHSPVEWLEGIEVMEFNSRIIDRRTLAGRIMETVNECVESATQRRERDRSLAVDRCVPGISRSAAR
jgi:hypothetical protein